MRTPGFRLWTFGLGILLIGGAVGCAASETDNVMQTNTGGSGTLGTGGRASGTGGTSDGGGGRGTGTSTCSNGASCVGPAQCTTPSGTTCRCTNGRYTGC